MTMTEQRLYQIMIESTPPDAAKACANQRLPYLTLPRGLYVDAGRGYRTGSHTSLQSLGMALQAHVLLPNPITFFHQSTMFVPTHDRQIPCSRPNIVQPAGRSRCTSRRHLEHLRWSHVRSMDNISSPRNPFYTACQHDKKALVVPQATRFNCIELGTFEATMCYAASFLQSRHALCECPVWNELWIH